MNESTRRAVTHFENQLAMNKAIGNVEGVATTNNTIAVVKSKFKGGRNNKELLKASQDLYELCVAEYSEEHESTICAGNCWVEM